MGTVIEPRASRRMAWRAGVASLIGAASLMISVDATASDPVVLNPGWMSGVIQLSPGFTITSGSAYAYSNDGYQASTSLSGPFYALTVEGAHAYRPYLYMYLSNGTPASSMRLNIYSNELSPIAVGETVTRDIVRQVADLSGAVNVSNGTLTRFRLWASASSAVPSESYYSEATFTGPSFALPMVLDDAVTVHGVADVVRPDGVSIQLPLDTQIVPLDAGAQPVNWEIDISAITTGAIAGTIDLGNFSALSGHSVTTSGYDSFTSGVNVSTWQAADGQYSLNNLVPGAYWVRATSYFGAPYGYLVHSPQYTYVTVSAGATTTVDYVSPLGFLRGSLQLDGLRRNTDYMVSGYVRAHGQGSGYGLDYVTLPSGAFDLATTAGDWRVGEYRASFQRTAVSDPSLYLNAWFETRNNAAAVTTVAGGDDIGGMSLPVTTTETLLVLDVAEAPGQAEILIGDPRLDGTVSGYPGSKRFYAYGQPFPSPRPFVRIVAEPGTYQVAAYARVDGSYSEFKNFTLELHSPTPLDAGPAPAGEIFPAPSLDLSVTFLNDIPASGYITATALPLGPTPPFGYKLAEYAYFGDAVYYDIMTNVGTVEALVCLPYDDTVISDAVAEITLRPWHYVLNQYGWWDWVDLWEGKSSQEAMAAGWIRLAENQICGITPSFSIFALMQPADSDGDGVLDLSDNCPNAANDGQDDLDGDGLGDACDDDADGDGVPDDIDLCPLAADPSQPDLDGDGLGDACDDDDDSDGVPDAADNCPGVPNDQSDQDGDGLGDACEDDTDGDGTDDNGDNCPLAANADQADLDGDGIGDICDDDLDGDGIANDIDVCPLASDASQADLDGDGVGDACDGDDDGDGVPDATDNCPDAFNTDQTDLDGDGQGDLCDADIDGDGVDDGLDNCPILANADQTDLDGDGAGDACDGDDDGDGIPDDTDDCPASQGADADQDGCADQAADLCELVQSMSLAQGVTNSLCAKSDAAAAANSSAAAQNLIEGFIHQVEAQRNHKIPSSQADLLVSFATNALAALP